MEVPIGTILPYAGIQKTIGSIQPHGVWLLCDGREVDRAKYAILYTIIGDFWGEGDGDVTFNIPELRGYFLRGTAYGGVDVNSGNPVDADLMSRIRPNSTQGPNEVGSYQGDAVGPHNHYRRGDHETDGGAPSDRCASVDIEPITTGKTLQEATVSQNDPAINTNALKNWQNIGNESHPKNAYVNFIIKALPDSSTPIKLTPGLPPRR